MGSNHTVPVNCLAGNRYNRISNMGRFMRILLEPLDKYFNRRINRMGSNYRVLERCMGWNRRDCVYCLGWHR